MARVSEVTNGAARPAAPITGLSHVQLVVSDLRVSADWYTTVLGLECQAEDVGAGYVALRHRQARLVIVLSTVPEEGTGSGDGVGSEGARPGSPGSLDHLAFAVPDGTALQAWADHLAGAGIGHQGIALENGNPSLQFRDPDGNAIELVAGLARRGEARPVPLDANSDRPR